MYDSIDAFSIPRDAGFIAGYVDGPLSQWNESDWSRFPLAKKARISTWGPRHLGDTLDIENGDSVPSDVPDWVDNALGRGIRVPKLYCSLSQFPVVRSYAGSRPVLYWIAHYTNVPHLPAGADACQWASSPAITGGGFDLSVITPKFADSLTV